MVYCDLWDRIQALCSPWKVLLFLLCLENSSLSLISSSNVHLWAQACSDSLLYGFVGIFAMALVILRVIIFFAHLFFLLYSELSGTKILSHSFLHFQCVGK